MFFRVRAVYLKPSFVGSNPTPHSIQINIMNLAEIYNSLPLFLSTFCDIFFDLYSKTKQILFVICSISPYVDNFISKDATALQYFL